MNILGIIIFFIFGTIFGSFFAVVGQKLPIKENFITTKSRCDHCFHRLKWYDLIPLVSYIISLGKCRYCKQKIDPMLFLIELFTGILFAISFYSFNLSLDLVIALGIISLLMIIFVSDIMYLIIPDSLLVFFGIYFLIVQYFRIGLIDTLYHILIGVFLFTLMYIIMLLGNKAFKKESLGGGDIKLMFIFGLILDPLLGVFSIFIGSLVAMPTSIYLLIKQKERVLPFGPFLVLALLLLYFSKITAQDIITFLGF